AGVGTPIKSAKSRMFKRQALRQDGPSPTSPRHAHKRAAMTLRGKKAGVTGSKSGLGHGIALAPAQDGANIVINGLGSEKDNDKAIAEVKKLGTRVAFDGANMLRHNQIAEMIAKAERDFGSVDILVNNAGIQHVAPVEEFPIEQWDSIIAIN